jgi:hypothetical protein
MQTENLKISPEIMLWKKLGITSCTMEFSCGGDSMNDYSFTFYTNNKSKKKGAPAVTEILCPELETYFDNEVFNRVEFYVNSDGHYQGESGNVEITLDEESNDEEEHEFSYSKSAQSEWSERHIEVIEIELTKKMVEFITDNVLNINGGDGTTNTNYKRDVILSDDDEKLVEEIETLLDKEVNEFEPEDVEGELQDFYTFTTNDDEKLETLTIKENKLLLVVNRETIVYRDGDD